MTDIPPPGGSAPAPLWAPTPTQPGQTLPSVAPVSTPPIAGSERWATEGREAGGDPSIGRPAGFWRRYWARGVTAVVWLVASATVTTVISMITLFVTSSTEDTLILNVGGVLAFVANLVVFHLVWAKPLRDRGSTVGMRQLGLELHVVGSPALPPSSRATLRSVIAFLPILLAGALPYAYALSGSDAVALSVALAVLGSSVVVLLGALWSLVSERRQTLWDLAANTVVTVRQPPSWLAVLAFVLGVNLIQFVPFTLGAIGLDEIRRFLERPAGFSEIFDLLVPALPTLAGAAVTIVVSSFAVKSTEWGAERRAGRGLAKTGMFLGWSVPVLLVLGVLLGVVYQRIISNDRQNCTEERKEVNEAITSFRTLNGTDPTIADLSEPLYLDDETVNTRWRIVDGKVRPIGDCRPT